MSKRETGEKARIRKAARIRGFEGVRLTIKKERGNIGAYHDNGAHGCRSGAGQ